MTLAITAELAFGLAFDVEKESGKASGFAPAAVDLGVQKELFGNLRLCGFAAMLRCGFTKKLIVIGGNEGRYKDEHPMINRAQTIKSMLVQDFGIDADLVDAIPSSSNTLGNIAIIKETVGRESHRAFAVVSNHYHLPRIGLDLMGAELAIPMYSAEAFLLVAKRDEKADIVRQLGGGPLAERCGEEIQGIADKITGKYKSKTDVPFARAVKPWYRFGR